MSKIFSTKPIDELKELFGREDDLDKALSYLSLEKNFQVIAPRRFGKTSFLKVLQKELLNEETLFPADNDACHFSSQGTANAAHSS